MTKRIKERPSSKIVYMLICVVIAVCSACTCDRTPEPTQTATATATTTATATQTATPAPVDPTGVTGRFLFADGPPPPERMNLALCVAHLDWPSPYCVLSSEAEWQFPVEGVFLFYEEAGDYGIAAYVPWIPTVILLHWPGSSQPIIFNISEGITDLGNIEYSDMWCELDPTIDC